MTTVFTVLWYCVSYHGIRVLVRTALNRLCMISYSLHYSSPPPSDSASSHYFGPPTFISAGVIVMCIYIIVQKLWPLFIYPVDQLRQARAIPRLHGQRPLHQREKIVGVTHADLGRHPYGIDHRRHGYGARLQEQPAPLALKGRKSTPIGDRKQQTTQRPDVHLFVDRRLAADIKQFGSAVRQRTELRRLVLQHDCLLSRSDMDRYLAGATEIHHARIPVIG